MATALGISRQTLYDILNEKQPVTAEMAVRFDKLFGNGANFWVNREIDFYDSKGKPGTLYREAGDDWKGNRHSLLYVRADLLRRYLTDTRQVLVWCNWGERDWLKKMEGHERIRNPARQRIYQAHDHIHRSFFEWQTKHRKVV